MILSRKFLPLFISQFTNALNDNVMKSSFIILITYQISSLTDSDIGFMILLINGIFSLPFVLFAGTAGVVGDKYERAYIVRVLKIIELCTIIFSIYGFSNQCLEILYICIFLMGLHSTFYAPLKYSIMTDHLQKPELLTANSYVESGTFLSISLGMLLGNYYNQSSYFVISLMIICSLTGIVSSFYIPLSNNYNQHVKIKYNIFLETNNILKYTSSNKPLFITIICISWFWFFGSVLFSQIPVLVKSVMNGGESIVALLYGAFTIGAAIGSALCVRIFNEKASTKYMVSTSILMSIFCVEIFFAVKIATTHTSNTSNVYDFFQNIYLMRVAIDFILASCISTIYVVPLFTIMQYFSQKEFYSRIISANSLINFLFIILSTVFVGLLIGLHYSIEQVFLVTGIINIIFTYLIYHYRIYESISV